MDCLRETFQILNWLFSFSEGFMKFSITKWIQDFPAQAYKRTGGDFKCYNTYL